MHLSSPISRVLAAMAILTPLGLSQDGSIKPYLPASTVMVVSLPDIGTSLEEMRQMPLAKMWAEDEVQDFFADIIKMAEDHWDEARQEMPVNPDDLAKLRIDGLTFAVTKLDLAVGPDGPMPEIGVMVQLDFGESAEAWNGLIDMAMGMIQENAGDEVSVETVDVGDATMTTLTPKVPEGEVARAWLAIARMGTGIVIGTLKDDVTSTLESMEEGEPVLTASETYRAAFDNLDLEGAEAETFVRLEPLVDFGMKALELAAQMEPDFPAIDMVGIRRALDALGLSSVQAIAAACRYEDGSNVTQSYVVSPKNRRAGLLATGGGELSLDFLPWVPKDAVSFSAATMDVAGIYDTIIKAVQAYDPEVAEMVIGQLAMMEEQAGFSLRNDLFGAFGEKFLTWSMPLGGAIGAAPEMAVLIEVDNEEGLLKSLDTITQLSQGTLKMETVERRGITAHQISINLDLGTGSPMVNLSTYRPTFAFKDGFMVMGFSAGDVGRAFDRMDREPDPEGDIRGNEEFAPFLGRLPQEGLTSLSFTDWKANFEGIYQMMTMVLAFVPVTDEVPLDFALLPDSLTLTQHLSGGISYSVADDNGFHSTSVSPFGPEVIAVGAAVGAFAGILYSDW